MNVLPAGDHAVLVEFDRDIDASGLHAAAHYVRSLDGVLACIVGHSSLYVVFINAPPKLDFTMATRQPGNPATHQIKVSFRDEYAPQLTEFLTLTKQTKDDFLKRIAQLSLTVRYLGFRGGYAYLDGWPAEWAMPRRATSRPVTRGSFAIAAAVAGFYPIDTPGGWNILGRTSENVENRFAAGDRIQIISTDEVIRGNPATRQPGNLFPGIVAPFVTRVSKPNWKNLEHGLSVGGPFDPEAADAARLASSSDGDVFEFAQIGPKVTPDSPVILGWCDVNGVRVQRVRRDETYDFGRIRNGLRGYLAVGDRPGRVVDLKRDDRLTIRVMRGPHDIGLDEFECEVTPKLDRVGVRMRPMKPLTAPADLPSIGMQFGSVQLHPDGSVVAMGPDHPVTGGYLQPMTVLWSERWKLAHLSPGERVTFVAQ